jgi:hypothetical protein
VKRSEVAARTRDELRSEELDGGIGREPAPAVEHVRHVAGDEVEIERVVVTQHDRRVGRGELVLGEVDPVHR